ncbi:hypothetical protein [Flavobacterium sp.]|uniref:hypothetical protein n=1 Tax=Flavobacterium sp. TaxID=239 RepID=UPI003527438C
MKKIKIVVIIAIGSFAVSCTADTDVVPASKSNFDTNNYNYLLLQKTADSTAQGDTGGQSGSTPIRP